MEEDCKASWDHLRAIAKHDGNTTMKIKMSEFLTDCAERIMVATIVHRRVTNRFRKFLLWLGTPPAQVRETKPGTFCRIVSEFALENRTTRDRVLQQMEKKANHRERSKTRGKMINQIGSTNGLNSLSNYDSPVTYGTKEDRRADAELRQLLGSDISDTESMRTGTWGRSRKSMGLGRNTSIRDDYLTDAVTDGDDEILEVLSRLPREPLLIHANGNEAIVNTITLTEAPH
ncbi:FH1/FH2 domain-containing protein 3-like isoform X2 [Daphnia pulicaria]|nr:FH1/FH2 domain-containing protein 3-like isoform X2 [Daphnia pulicaria]